MTEEMEIDCLHNLFQLLISRLCKEKGRSEDKGRHLWWLLRSTSPNMYCKNHLWEEKKENFSLASHLGILDDEFGEFLAAGKLSKVQSWYKNMGMSVQTHRYHSISWIYFDAQDTRSLGKHPSCLGFPSKLWMGGFLKWREYSLG